MDTNELLASLRVLAHVARADEKIAQSEKTVLEGAGARDLGRSPGELVAETTDLDEQLRLLKTPAMRRRTLAEAYALAYVDGRCTPEEQHILARLHETRGDASTPRPEDAGALWQTRGEKLRAEVEALTTTYLHAVHEDSLRGELSQARYDQHVAELARIKAERQRAFLGDT